MLRCSRPFAVAVGITAVLVLWYMFETDHGHSSPTVWTNACNGVCVIAWMYCLADWRWGDRSKVDHSPRSDGDADSTVRRIGSR